MKMTYEGGWFIATDAYSHHRQLKKDGFMYSGSPNHVWKSRQWSRALRYRTYFDKIATEAVCKVSLKEDSNYYYLQNSPFKNYDDLDPDQKKGIRFCLNRSSAYLNFEPGVGKTPTAIMVLNALFYAQFEHFKGCVITLPPSIITQWKNEIKKWQWFNYTIDTVTKKDQKIDFDKDIVLVADSLLSYKCKVVEQLQKCDVSLMVIDEAHRFQTVGTKRTTRLFGHINKPGTGIVHNAKKVVYLSGTAIRRSPISMYTVFQASAWNKIKFRSHHSFGVYFCDGHEKNIGARRIWDFSGASNIHEFKKALKGFLLYKELKLKTKTRKRMVALDVKKKSKEFSKLDRHFKSHYSFEDMPTEVGEIASYRKELGEIITPLACDYIIEEMLKDQDKKFLIVAWHIDVIDRIQEKLESSKSISSCVIYGKTSRKKRDSIIDEFQNGKLQAVIAQVKTMIGLNMQAGSRIIFVESSFSWDDDFQAIRRLERRGQTKNILVDYLAIANSYQMHVIDTAIKKENVKNNILNQQ